MFLTCNPTDFYRMDKKINKKTTPKKPPRHFSYFLPSCRHIHLSQFLKILRFIQQQAVFHVTLKHELCSALPECDGAVQSRTAESG